MHRYEKLIERLGIAGYDKIEPAILIAWALGWPVRLAGRPGTAKTMLATMLCHALFGRDLTRVLDCAKENILTIAGLPDMEKMKRGIFDFVRKVEINGEESGGRFLWDKKGIVFNEFTRMPKEIQNIVLEVLQERRLFDQPLPIMRVVDPIKVDYCLIATENPEGLGVQRMDEAVMDRFYLLVNVPDGQEPVGALIRQGVVSANLNKFNRPLDGRDSLLAEFAHALRREYARVLNNPNYVKAVTQYAAALFELFFNAEKNTYVSYRRQALVPEVILGFAAYRLLVYGDAAPKEVLPEAALNALDFAIRLPLKFSDQASRVLANAHSQAKINLGAEEMSPKDAFQYRLLERPNVEDQIGFLAGHIDDFKSLLNNGERENILGKLLQKASSGALLELRRLIGRLGGHEELYRKVEIKIIADLSNAIDTLRKEVLGMPIWTFDDLQYSEQFQLFADLLAKKTLPSAAVTLLLSPNADPMTKLGRVIDMIEVRGEDLALAA